MNLLSYCSVSMYADTNIIPLHHRYHLLLLKYCHHILNNMQSLNAFNILTATQGSQAHSIGCNVKLLLGYCALEPEKLKSLQPAEAVKMICDSIYQRLQEEWDILPHNGLHNTKPKLEY